MNRTQLIDNFLTQLYHSLRENDRFVQERGAKSYFEAFWGNINNAFSMGLKGYRPPNYTVESFYRGTLDVNEFRLQVRETVVDKNLDKLDANLDPLLTISWEIYSSVISRKHLCSKIPRLCCRQLWGMFNKLDSDSSGFAAIDDIIDVISNIHKANGREEPADNIREWFCDQRKIDFWSFFSALVETHDDLLTPSALLSVYDVIFFEILKEGKMKKKGHKVANWKDRWFVLSSTQLCYYESQENRSLKGTVIIGKNSKVEKLNPTKDHPYLFRITDGKSGIRYDLSAHDPQIMCDWLQKLEVAACAHSEEGYSTLHKLRLAENRLFPHIIQGNPLPAYKQGGVSEYNEGIYRVVQPSKMTNQPSSDQVTSAPITIRQTPRIRKGLSNDDLNIITSTTPPLGSLPIPTYEAVKSIPGPKIKPYKSESCIDLSPNHSSPEPTYVNVGSPRDTTPISETDFEPMSDLEPMSPSPIPVTITQQISNGTMDHNDKYINVHHVDIGGKDYALVDKGQVNENESFSPPLPPQRIHSEEHGYVNVPHTNIEELDYAIVDKGEIVNDQVVRQGNNSKQPPPPPPVAKKRTLRPTQSLPYEPNPAKPIPAKPNPAVNNNKDVHVDYTTLDFDDRTEPSSNSSSKPNAKPRSQIAKKRFEYSEVVLEDTTVKDVDKALRLKANRPPPTPPSRYNSKPNQEFHSKPVNSPTHNSNFQHPASYPMASSPSNGIIDLDAPPPPPRRRTSFKKSSEVPPVVPPR